MNYGLDFGTTEEKDTERNRIRTNRLISGLGLATSWIATVIVDSLVWDGYRQYTLVPVIGPWITLVKMASNEDQGWPGAKELLFLSGVAQTGFATYFIISLARHPKPRETKNVAIWTNFNSINLRNSILTERGLKEGHVEIVVRECKENFLSFPERVTEMCLGKNENLWPGLFPAPNLPPLYPCGKLVFHRGWNENPTPGRGICPEGPNQETAYLTATEAENTNSS